MPDMAESRFLEGQIQAGALLAVVRQGKPLPCLGIYETQGV